MAKGWLTAWGLGSVALGGASLIVPLYVVQLGGDPFTLGLLASAAAFVGVPGALVFGRLADRTGNQRGLVLAALAMIVAMLALVPLLSSIGLVIVANAVVWFAFAAATPVLTLLAVAGADPQAWSERIALLNKSQGVGWALGLALGAVWTMGARGMAEPVTVQRYFLAFTAACAGAALVLSARSLPPDPRPKRRVDRRRLQRALRRADRFSVRIAVSPFTIGRARLSGLDPRAFVRRFTPMLALYFGAAFLFFTGFATFFAPLPAYLTDTGFGSSEVFVLYLISSVGAAVFFDGAGTLARRQDVPTLQSAGLLLRGGLLPTVALVGGALGSTPVGLGVAAAVFALIGLTWAVIAVTAGTLVTALAPEAVRGEALGVYAALAALAGGIGSLLGGWLATAGYLIAFGAAGGLVVVGAAIVFGLRHRAVTARSRTVADATAPDRAE
jgi:MFS family permease